ncbi:hypothetical protein A7318_09230 [Pseudomonas lurida]|nr:hypothetical protein A7318_09230 [Pseudomonas lurida]
MLVITRMLNQRVYIGDEILIKLIKVEGDTVSIGIHAPKKKRIVRSEQDKSSVDDGSTASVVDALT